MEHRSRSKKFLSVLLMTPCLAFGKSLHCLWIYFQCRADTETRALTRNLLFFIRWLLRKFKYCLTRTAEGAGLSLSLMCEFGFGVCVRHVRLADSPFLIWAHAVVKVVSAFLWCPQFYMASALAEASAAQHLTPSLPAPFVKLEQRWWLKVVLPGCHQVRT